MGFDLGFGVTIHELIGDETGDFASTALRALIAEGRCVEAARQLNGRQGSGIGTEGTSSQRKELNGRGH